MRAIDFHVHAPIAEWFASMRGYLEPAARYFRARIAPQSIDELAALYQRLDVTAVLLGWDAETATQLPRVPNDLLAEACRRHPETFVAFGGVDPHKGERALRELERFPELRLKGVKFHPSLQAFAPDDERFWPLFARCEELGLPALFHTGTSGIGARQPGGQGIRLDYARPLRLDAVAAAFPRLRIVAAHFGWPWHLELIAMALHKTNVYIEISGWSPRYLPAEVVREMKGSRLADQFVFGSDHPFISASRSLEELGALDIPDVALRKILVENGRQLLGLSA